MTEIEKAAQAWLVANDWDYQKYGDRRPDRSAYDGQMNYEISGLLFWAFEEGAKWGLDEGERAQCRKCYNRGYEDGARLGEQDEDTCSSQQVTHDE